MLLCRKSMSLTLQPDNNRYFEAECRSCFNDALSDHVTSHDASKDVHQNRPHLQNLPRYVNRCSPYWFHVRNYKFIISIIVVVARLFQLYAKSAWSIFQILQNISCSCDLFCKFPEYRQICKIKCQQIKMVLSKTYICFFEKSKYFPFLRKLWPCKSGSMI